MGKAEDSFSIIPTFPADYTLTVSVALLHILQCDVLATCPIPQFPLLQPKVPQFVHLSIEPLFLPQFLHGLLLFQLPIIASQKWTYNIILVSPPQYFSQVIPLLYIINSCSHQKLSFSIEIYHANNCSIQKFKV